MTIQNKGLYIEIDGPDGAGKGTQIQLLTETLTGSGNMLHNTFQPGGTDFGQEMRNIVLHKAYEHELSPHVLMLCFVADRAHHMREIATRLADGHTVISDRGPGSTYAYQIHAAYDGSPVERYVHSFSDLHSLVLDGLFPDLCIWLDVDVEVSRQRNARSGKPVDRFERKSDDFHRLVREGYQRYYTDILPTLSPRTKVLKIEAHDTPESIHTQIIGAIENIKPNNPA